MYYVMIAEQSAPAVARNIGVAWSSTEARRLAQQLDLSLHGRISGRLFYLDEATFLDWCNHGRALRAGPGKVVSTSKRLTSHQALIGGEPGGKAGTDAEADAAARLEPAT